MAGYNVPIRHIQSDIEKLIIDGKFQVFMDTDPHVLFVIFRGPFGTLYDQGTWKVRIHLPRDYPFRPPTVTFLNKIYHPNIDEHTGILSASVLEKYWTMRHQLVDIFQHFLPELLNKPIIDLAVNKIASTICVFAAEEYKAIVREYIRQYAKS